MTETTVNFPLWVLKSNEMLEDLTQDLSKFGKIGKIKVMIFTTHDKKKRESDKNLVLCSEKTYEKIKKAGYEITPYKLHSNPPRNGYRGDFFIPTPDGVTNPKVFKSTIEKELQICQDWKLLSAAQWKLEVKIASRIENKVGAGALLRFEDDLPIETKEYVRAMLENIPFEVENGIRFLELHWDRDFKAKDEPVSRIRGSSRATRPPRKEAGSEEESPEKKRAPRGNRRNEDSVEEEKEERKARTARKTDDEVEEKKVDEERVSHDEPTERKPTSRRIKTTVETEIQ